MIIIYYNEVIHKVKNAHKFQIILKKACTFT